MKIHVWSDPHFYHRNVISYCKRPFETQEEMHEVMINRFHEKVEEGDTVYLLGDFAFCGVNKGAEIVKRLRGNKKITIVLVKGNHDPSPARCLKMGFDMVAENGLTLYWAGRKFELNHFPYPPTRWERFVYKLKNFWKFWRRQKYNELRYMELRPVDNGRWLIHGHVHNAWKVHRKRRMINAGVDVHNFYPVSMSEIATMIRQWEGTNAAS